MASRYVLSRIRLEEILAAIRKGAAVGFVSYLIVMLLMLLYAIFNNYDIVVFISREGIMFPALIQLVGWIILFAGTYLLRVVVEALTGESEPEIEGTAEVIKGVLGIITIICVAMALFIAFTTNWQNIWSILISASIILAFFFTAVEIWGLNKKIR